MTKSKLKAECKTDKKESFNNSAKENKLSAYKRYLNSQNPNYNRYKDKYFAYHDDVKHPTHKIIDW